MRIECESCGHLGDGIVRRTSLGLGLECGQCGFIMLVEDRPPPTTESSHLLDLELTPIQGVSVAPEPPAEVASEHGLEGAPSVWTSASMPTTPIPRQAPLPQAPAAMSISMQPPAANTPQAPPAPVQQAAAVPEVSDEQASPEESHVRLQPRALMVERGEGEHRCPKCGWRQDDPEACHRCGLVFDLAREGARPWEMVPPGKEMAAAELDRRWSEMVAGDFRDPDPHDDFIQFATRAYLLERAAQRYRFYAQDHTGTPEGELAVASLERVIELLNATFLMQGGGSDETKAFQHRVSQFKTVLYIVAILMCLGVVWLALQYGSFG
ncbi:MAG: hypothetical protein AAFX99_33305 [Myxococcota bacterium]